MDRLSWRDQVSFQVGRNLKMDRFSRFEAYSRPSAFISDFAVKKFEVGIQTKTFFSFQGRESRRRRDCRWMQTPLQNCQIQHSEDHQGSRQQERLRKVLKFYENISVITTRKCRDASHRLAIIPEAETKSSHLNRDKTESNWCVLKVQVYSRYSRVLWECPLWATKRSPTWYVCAITNIPLGPAWIQAWSRG